MLCRVQRIAGREQIHGGHDQNRDQDRAEDHLSKALAGGWFFAYGNRIETKTHNNRGEVWESLYQAAETAAELVPQR